jgi:hypothetical protein
MRNENPAERRGSCEFSSCPRPGRASRWAAASAALGFGQVADPAGRSCWSVRPAAAGSYCPGSCESPNVPKYNLNAHHSNYRTYLCSRWTKTSVDCQYILNTRIRPCSMSKDLQIRNTGIALEESGCQRTDYFCSSSNPSSPAHQRKVFAASLASCSVDTALRRRRIKSRVTGQRPIYPRRNPVASSSDRTKTIGVPASCSGGSNANVTRVPEAARFPNKARPWPSLRRFSN